MKNLLKVIRYFRIYGLSRTAIKIAGRSRDHRLKFFFPRTFFRNANPSISLIGCGQFGFSTICYFLYKGGKNQFLQCTDIDQDNAKSTGKFWQFEPTEADQLLANPNCKIVYIASNHASHTSYAINALKRNIDVYVEKPIAVDEIQLTQLCESVKASSANICVGYNRPFSRAVSSIVSEIKDDLSPISLSCFITGHFIEADHWYRDPKEGTRVCGNMGHWIDLTVHLMAQRGKIPETFEINITQASKENPDDNIVVSFSTSYQDVITITLTSRFEPFEGINETINFQNQSIIAKINDFRSLEIWKGNKFTRKKYRNKDVGHKQAILQPFSKKARNFEEVLLSSIVMLEVKDMVVHGIVNRVIKPTQSAVYKNYIK